MGLDIVSIILGLGVLLLLIVFFVTITTRYIDRAKKQADIKLVQCYKHLTVNHKDTISIELEFFDPNDTAKPRIIYRLNSHNKQSLDDLAEELDSTLKVRNTTIDEFESLFSKLNYPDVLLSKYRTEYIVTYL